MIHILLGSGSLLLLLLQVDPSKGDWAAVERLSARYDVMVEFMVNHISPASDEFQDFLKHGMESEYAEMFIHWNDFWEGGMSAIPLPIRECIAYVQHGRKLDAAFSVLSAVHGCCCKSPAG